MVDIIGSIMPPLKTDIIPIISNHLLMLLLKKLTLLINNSTILPKVSQVIISKLNGVVFLELKKVEFSLSKLDLMMDLDFGLTMLWLLIIGVCMELNMLKEKLSFQRDIITLKFTCSKMVEVLPLMPTGIQIKQLISNQFMFSIQLLLSELNIFQTQYI
mgnify:CR=1 FL=1